MKLNYPLGKPPQLGASQQHRATFDQRKCKMHAQRGENFELGVDAVNLKNIIVAQNFGNIYLVFIRCLKFLPNPSTAGGSLESFESLLECFADIYELCFLHRFKNINTNSTQTVLRVCCGNPKLCSKRKYLHGDKNDINI